MENCHEKQDKEKSLYGSLINYRRHPDKEDALCLLSMFDKSSTDGLVTRKSIHQALQNQALPSAEKAVLERFDHALNHGTDGHMIASSDGLRAKLIGGKPKFGLSRQELEQETKLGTAPT